MAAPVDKGGVIQRNLQSGVASAWFYFLWTESDTAIKNVLKENQGLLYAPVGFKTGCSCNCSNLYEEMRPTSQTTPTQDYIEKQRTNIALGHCEHVKQDHQLEFETSNIFKNDKYPDLKSATHDERKTLFGVFVRDPTFCVSSVVTWVYPIHVLSARGYWKALRYSLKHLNPNHPDEFFTHPRKLSVLYISVLHRQYNTLRCLSNNNFLQIFMASKSVSQYMSNDNLYFSLAIRHDNVKALAILLRAQESYRSDSPLETFPLISEMISEAFREDSEKVLRYFINRHDSFETLLDLAISESILQVVMEKPSTKLLQLVIKKRLFTLDQLLQAAVDHDNVEAAKTVLETGEKRNESFYPDYLPVILHNSSKMLEILEESPIVTQGTITDYYENYRLAKTIVWAKVFKFHDFVTIMSRIQFPEVSMYVQDLSNPLLDIFPIEIKSSKVSRTVLSKRLIDEGWSVNTTNSYNATPLTKAFKVADYTCARMLLFAGADPCLGDGCFNLLCKEVIREVLYVNADIYSDKRCMQCLAHFNIAGCKSMAEKSRLFMQTMRSLHTFPMDLKEHVSKILDGFTKTTPLSEEHLRELNDMINQPRPLYILCRNRLRIHFGIQIHEFVNSVVVPSEVRKMLLLQDCLQDFQIVT